MPVYTFAAGAELVEIKSQRLDDLEIKANNKVFQTGEKFVPLSKVLKPEQANELKQKLNLVYDNYLINEFAKMGYKLVKKNV